MYAVDHESTAAGDQEVGVDGGHRVDQVLHSFIIVQPADKEERRAVGVARQVDGRTVVLSVVVEVDRERHDGGLLAVGCEVIGVVEQPRRRDKNVVEIVEEAVQERTVEFERGLLTDDVAVVGCDDRGIRRWRGEVGDDAEGIREVVVDDIGVATRLPESCGIRRC